MLLYSCFLTELISPGGLIQFSIRKNPEVSSSRIAIVTL